MRSSWRTTAAVVGSAGLVLGILTAGEGLALAAPASRGGTYTCTGTLTSPGELSGTYSNVLIDGTCAVQSGPVRVDGNLTVAPNGNLNAGYGSDGSQITIDGNLIVLKNGSALLGCDTNFDTLWAFSFPPPVAVPSFPCADDPNPNAPTLSSHDIIGGNVIAQQALGIVLNNDSVEGNYIQNGGGGGPSCAPTGVFGFDFGLPSYSVLEGDSVSGNVSVTNLNTCWFGVYNVTIGGSYLTIGNTNSLLDGNEIGNDIIQGNVICLNNNPAIQFGDGNGQPNKVGHQAIGQCAFGVTALNPPPEAGVTGVTPIVQPISVPLH